MRTRPTALALVMGVALFLATACSKEREVAATVLAERGPASFTVPAEGYLEAMEAKPVAVPRVPTGALKVKELADEGQRVSPGEVLVVFDDTQLNIDLDNHKATFRASSREIERTDFQAEITSGTLETMRRVAEIERDNAEAFKIRDETIFSKLEILENEVREREASETVVYADAAIELRGEYYDIEKRILQVELGQAEGKLQRVSTSLGKLVLKAPIEGLVVYRKDWRGNTVSLGDSLWPGNVVMSIVDPTSTGLTAFVLERDAAGLEVGASADVLVDSAPGKVFEGKVARIAEISRPIESGSPVKYTEVKIEIDDEARATLRPGSKGSARISTAKLEDAIVVPRAAIHGPAESPYVVIESAAGREERPVTLGAGDLVRVSVSEGLEGGERLVIGSPSSESPQRSTPSKPAMSA